MPSRRLAGRISSYRSGYLPSERREIETELAEDRLDAVISTSALEMGIDIGGLDACILVGYPGPSPPPGSAGEGSAAASARAWWC